MDMLRLYQDYSVDYITEGHKHAQPGWINVSCPYCVGNPGYHLGFHIDNEFYHCWRCGGGKQIVKTLSLILQIPERDAFVLVKQYGLLTTRKRVEEKPREEVPVLKFPTGVMPLPPQHKRYLLSRWFDPDRLVREWGILGTGPVAKLDGIDYKNRIIIPFYWQGKIVTFDSRSISISESYKMRYKACPESHEVIPHKEILYLNKESPQRVGICVEGPTDVWRMGRHSFATSGIQYTPRQVRAMSKLFQRVIVIFDDETQAQKQADKLVAELRFRGVDAAKEVITGDPGSLSDIEAQYIVNQIIK